MNSRILFVVKNPGDEFIGIMIISSLLKESGYRVEMVEAEYNKVISKLNDAIPTILAYSTPSDWVNYYLRLNKEIKEDFKVFSVFGGPHPTSVPEMIEEDGVDGVCMGEGEFPMLELAQNLSSGRPIRDIRNWWIKENGAIFKNPLRPLIENLDDLPFPDRELFEAQPLLNERKMSVISGRGCPYDCGYCFNYHYRQLYNEEPGRIRKRSINNIVEEINKFRNKFPLRFINFNDSLFILPHEWLEQFSSIYKKDVGLPFSCNVRADNINSKVVKLLKDAGCYSVSLGVETADDYLREHILGRKMTKEQILDAAKLIKGQKIRLRTTSIIGIPCGSIEKDLETIKLNIECKVDYAKGIPLQPFPGTSLWEKGYRCHNYEYARLESYNYLKKFYTQRQLENLNHLFSVIVALPFLLHFVKILVRLPLRYLYRAFYILCEAYCVSFRIYSFDPKEFFIVIGKYGKITQEKFTRRRKNHS